MLTSVESAAPVYKTRPDSANALILVRKLFVTSTFKFKT